MAEWPQIFLANALTLSYNAWQRVLNSNTPIASAHMAPHAIPPFDRTPLHAHLSFPPQPSHPVSPPWSARISRNQPLPALTHTMSAAALGPMGIASGSIMAAKRPACAVAHRQHLMRPKTVQLAPRLLPGQPQQRPSKLSLR